MGKKSIALASSTPHDWVSVILDNFDEFLADHANCERKASALAMSLISRYPDRHEIIPTLIGVAREELEHFDDVYTLMRTRAVELVPDIKDPYVEKLYAHVRHGRETRFLDRLLISSVIECRGAERFGIIARALDDEQLRDFYDQLWKAETKHGHQFADMALKIFDAETVYQRLAELMDLEAEVIHQLPWRASLH